MEREVEKLCVNCARGVTINDNQDFLHESIDSSNVSKLRKSRNNAVRSSQPVVIHNDTLPDLPVLDISSKRGCQFCTFLQHIITSEDTQDEAKRIYGSCFTDMKEPMDVSISVQFRWKGEDEQDSRGGGLLGVIVLLTFADDEVEIALLCLAEGLTGYEPSDHWLGLSKPLPQTYSGQDSLNWIAERFESDLKSQQTKGDDTNFFPERLIKVNNTQVRLVSRDDSREFPKGTTSPSYAALSYCWGSADDSKHQLKSTTTTLRQRQRGIEDAEMTKVLRDAVAVTRALHIPYLWVDALCILQDDISDWERQCVSIANLYAGASITICAASSTTCRKGFLEQRGARIRMPFQSKRRPDIHGSYYLQFKYAGISRELIYSEQAADANHCRWGNRGWVYQESGCASRSLLFGNANVHYLSPNNSYSMGGSGKSGKGSFHISDLKSQSREKIYKSWSDVLCQYSRFEEHSFTKIKDILPALSGLASQYHQYLQDEYHAGLWKGDLFKGLMWYWEGSSNTLPSRDCCVPSAFMRHHVCPIPSWSPLGRGMFVTYGAIYREDECFTDFQPEYLSLQPKTCPTGGNPFGEISSDWSIRVTAHVLDLCTLGKRTLDVHDTFNELGCRGTLLYDGKQLGGFELDFSYGDFADMYRDSADSSPVCMLDEIGQLSWLLLGSCKVRHSDESPDQMRRARGACGLILYQDPSSKRIFRVGVFFPGFPEHHHDGLNTIRRLGQIKTVSIV